MTTAPRNELSDVCWPALWLTAQADELVVLEHQHDLIALAGEHYRLVNVKDRLIDSQLQQWHWQQNVWQRQPAYCTLAELTEHFRRHAALCNVCCLAKLTFPDFTTLIDALKSID